MSRFRGAVIGTWTVLCRSKYEFSLIVRLGDLAYGETNASDRYKKVMGVRCVVWVGVASALTACRAGTFQDMHACPLSLMRRPAGQTGPQGLPAPRFVADAIEHGSVDCFEAGRHRTEPGKTHKLAYCEGSAVVYDGRRLVLASDKPIPGEARTSVFEVEVQGPARTGVIRYLQGSGYAHARKFEDATLTPDGRRVFLSTGFDRVMPGRDAWNGYNVLLTYDVGSPDAPQVVTADERPARTSVGLRDVLRPHLPTRAFPEGAPYFKVEGVAALPDQRLLLGVRELGASYKAFEYAVIVLEARWLENEAGHVMIDADSVRVAYRRDHVDVAGRRVGLSSIERDPDSGTLFLLASYEEEGPDAHRNLGGFLFTLDEETLAADGPLRPVGQPDGRPLHFVHKPEGLTFIGDGRALLLFDDDRVLECGVPGHVHKRQPHQTPIAILELRHLEGELAAAGGGPALTP